VPIQRRVKIYFISSDLFSPGESKRNSERGIARQVGENTTKNVAKRHISRGPG